MRSAWLGVTAAWVCLAGVAHAEPERVELRDGTILQGELVEKVPGDHVTLKLATGEVRRIEQGAIAEPRPKGPDSLAPPRDPGVPVSIQSDRPGTTLMHAEAIGVVQATNGYSAYAAVY
jgi:hypothetical protein